MSDRIALTIDVGSQPTGRVRVLPVLESDLETLRGGAEFRLGSGGALPDELRVRVRALLELGRFSASAGSLLPVLDGADRLLLLVGLGSRPSARALREAAAVAVGQIPAGEPWCLDVPRAGGEAQAAERLGALAEGVALGPYQFRQSVRGRSPLAGPCTLVTDLDPTVARRALEESRARAEGILLARDLVNTPAEEMGPDELADAARQVAVRHGMRARVLRGDEVEAAGFRMVARVGRAASRPPTVTIVEGGPAGRPPEVALIGKGVVFDTGGLDIKTGGNMLLMRKDMGGAGTVIGALETLGRLGCSLPFTAILPAAENAVGPLAMRPGDVLRAYDDQRVEIGNTDAEGRLLLADALAHGRELGAVRLLDVATLTGAARMALGPDLPALFGTDEDLVARLLDAAERSDEPLWRLPLVERYESWIDTPFADVNNSSSDRRAGAITAALFLRRFAKDSRWAHIDVYAWEDRGSPGTPRGGNGMGVKTVASTVLGLGADAPR